MRWLLYISSILVLLTLGVELCSSYGSVVVKDRSCQAYVLDGDDIEVKQSGLREHPLTVCDALSMPGYHVLIRWVKGGLILSLEGAKMREVHPGVRRHRWLCKDCC